MDKLKRAIDESDWPAALAILLERWRSERTPQLADLIDRVGARCGSPPPADTSIHRWWIDHARPYDAEMVSPLVAHADVKARSSDAMWATIREGWPDSAVVAALTRRQEIPQERNWIERVAAILAWPDDPRATRVLAGWLASEEVMVRTDVSEVYGEIGVRLGDLGDARALPLLATAPPGALVDAVRHRLEQPPVPDDPQLTALSAAVGVAGAELGPLWRAVADRPDDLGARTVLGDALVAAGDARGELISLQLAPHDAKRDRRINRLLDAWWEHWLGPIRPLVVRTEFRNGMLEVLHLGRPLIPQRVWDAARGHRELPTVHTVRLHPSSHVQPVEYARFVASLPHLATLEVDAPETLHELGTLTAPRLHTLVYTHPSQRLDVPPVLETFRTFAPGAPALAHITLDPVALGTELDGLVAALPSLFPQLRAIELVAPSRVATRELAERFASAPLVRLTTNR